MKEETIRNELDSLYNGNINHFKQWLKRASKVDILKAVMLNGDRDINKVTPLIERMIRYLDI